jgi:hypothetical protein
LECRRPAHRRILDRASGVPVKNVTITADSGQQTVLCDDPDSATHSRRFPDYHRLDLRLQYARRCAQMDATHYLDVINGYARGNNQGYSCNQDFLTHYDDKGIPFLSSFGVKIKF